MVSYNRLWKLLVDKRMSKADLRKIIGVAPNTMTKLRRDEYVSMEVLEKICTALHVEPGEVFAFLDNESNIGDI
ncbi:MAG TPA: transcriptional regulator [Ruminococcaceae bacterium]|nr:transcriptional regulator [Oscillospiraceae bacterium]